MNVSNTFLENRRWLWAVVYARLGDRSATEDVLQEVSLAAIRQSNPCEIGQIKAWLYQVAVRQVMLFRRSEARHRHKLQYYSQSMPQPESELSLERICRGEQLDAVRNALNQVRPSDRQVLLLKYSENLNCQAIAQLLGVRETTIQSRLLRARRRLRQILTDQEDFEEYSE